MTYALFGFILAATIIITARSYGPRHHPRTWAGGWKWLATRGAAEALLTGVVIGVLFTAVSAFTR